MKQKKYWILAISILIFVGIGMAFYYYVHDIGAVDAHNFLSENENAAEDIYQHENYSVNVNKLWIIDEKSDFLTVFYKNEEQVVSIEVYENCEYCFDTDSIITNIFGQHGATIYREEKKLDDYTQIKTKIVYVPSAAEQIKGIDSQSNELHYIYTNYMDWVIDIYINDTIMEEQEILQMIQSMVIQF